MQHREQVALAGAGRGLVRLLIDARPLPRCAMGVHRIVALTAAPGLAVGEAIVTLRREAGPAFLPRPLRLVRKLPRSETGNLPRAVLLQRVRGV